MPIKIQRARNFRPPRTALLATAKGGTGRWWKCCRKQRPMSMQDRLTRTAEQHYRQLQKVGTCMKGRRQCRASPRTNGNLGGSRKWTLRGGEEAASCKYRCQFTSLLQWSKITTGNSHRGRYCGFGLNAMDQITVFRVLWPHQDV
jgi:hypothetical protein